MNFGRLLVVAILAEDRLGRINAAFASYGVPEFPGMVTPDKYGPPHGKAVGCVSCHDGKIKGVMNGISDPAMVWHKVIDEKTMPPGLGKGPENNGKRVEIVRKLRADGAKEDKNWLRTPACPKEATPRAVFDGGVTKGWIDPLSPSSEMNPPSAGAGR